MLRYCVRCILPDTKPDLLIDEEGVCSACRAYERRGTIDWDERRRELEGILARYRRRGSNWDCIVPVSGGKDSTYQVVRMLQMGLNPLCVTATTCDLSAIGRKNIDNIKRLGVDYVEFSPDPLIRAKLNRIGLTEVGDISWPEHVAIFTIPVRAAVQYDVPLIVWGENSQNEYGGPVAAQDANVLTRRWLEEFGGLLGLRVSDLTETYGIPQHKLLPYQYPSDDELGRTGVTGFFLGHYIPWDGLSNAVLASAKGFTTLGHAVEGSMVTYENLDNHQTGIHDYFKFLKFGFGRATDIASLHIRRGRISREDGLAVVRKRDGRFPWAYLDKPLKEILEPLEMNVDDFIQVCDTYTNEALFAKDADGSLRKDHSGSLTKLNYDNP